VPGQPSPELCNNIDDDCDGAVDEESLAGRTCTRGVGLCADTTPLRCVAGQQICDARDTRDNAIPEVCNGIDDDCDGIVDDGLGNVALCGQGACRRLISDCEGGDVEVCDPFAGAAPETCNDIDDDCDGIVDETPTDTGAPCGAGQGTCRRDGLTLCREGRVECSAIAALGDDEQCNGLDDDCDGRTDEDPEDAGAACASGVGACRTAGFERCVARQITCDAVPAAPTPETCNATDDDCDGNVDEAVPRVQCGQGICARDLAGCVGGQAPVCNPLLGSRPEACNGVDDDCDGRIDEGTAVGPCEAGFGGCRVVGDRRCEDGEVICGAVPLAPRAESCNERDDDCDGSTDEGTGAGELCRTGVGLCVAFGENVCNAGQQVSCDATPFAAEPEECDLLDNDCDGRTDESLADLGGCAFGADGQCGVGRRACLGGIVSCTPVNQPVDEICDGLDNDCDRNIDEGLGTFRCGEGICGRDVPVCAFGTPQECTPLLGARAETCNGLDDDCDGRLDERTPGDGTACEAGAGRCLTVGVRRCVGGALTCDAVPEAGAEETCNAIDDDCDGVIDEETLEEITPCFDGIGACRERAFFTCVGGEAICPAVAGQPEPERCDVIDNDCDGDIDEDFSDQTCGVGACRRALVNCNDLGQPIACDPFVGASEELCNGIDDDCDGVTDEQAFNVGAGCGEGEGRCHRRGTLVCTQGELACSAAPGAPVAETCNALDDDCDGAIDEGANDVGQPCTEGDGICARDGTRRCIGGQPRCDAVPADVIAPEVCNGLDDDCDGIIDDGLGTVRCGAGVCARDVPACVDGAAPACDPLVGAAAEICNGADDDCDGEIDEAQGTIRCGRGVCQQETARCVNGQLAQCNPQEGSGVEICDNRDNDCDGDVDEEVFGDNQPCAAGIGFCEQVGTLRCLGGAFVCDAQPRAPIEESCNLRDDDCDGTVDEFTRESREQCSLGIGFCLRTGNRSCENGGVACRVVPGDPRPELCNDIDDDCDIAVDEPLFPADDCDLNNVSDGCELSRNRDALDCNGNGTIDRCDIDSGLSIDCNQNRVPDECGGDGNNCALDEEPPTVEIQPDALVVLIGQPLTFRVVAQDNVGVLLITASADDIPVPLDANNRATIAFATAGLHIIEAEAIDFATNRGSAFVEIRVEDPDDGQFPTIEIDPLPAEIVRPTPITGRIDDASLVYWEVTYGPQGASNANFIASGVAPIEGQIALIDPEAIGEGIIELRIYAEDAAGRSRTATVVLTIGRCDPSPEICDYGDNDCDGTADEGYGNVGAACIVGVGGCRREGVVGCLVDGSGTACTVAPGQPSPERCDAIDHDCDGDPFDGFPVGEPCSDGVGACRVDGIFVCRADGSAAACTATARPPAGGELCDTIDNDCDGRSDEGFLEVPCGTGACARIVPECDGGVLGEALCDPLEGASAETCNRIDDDCDGRIDEQPADVGARCRSGLGICGREGNTFCLGGAITCDARPGAPDFEVCNGLDDDCDGRTDDGADCADDEPPFVLVLLSAATVGVGEAVAIQVVADDGALADVQLTIDGVPVPLDAQGTAIFVPEEPGAYVIEAIAIDEAGNESRDTVTITARLDAPVARIRISPARIAEGDRFRTRFVLDGTASSGGQLGYRWTVPGGRVVAGALDEARVTVTFAGAGPETVTLDRAECHGRRHHARHRAGRPPPVRGHHRPEHRCHQHRARVHRRGQRRPRGRAARLSLGGGGIAAGRRRGARRRRRGGHAAPRPRRAVADRPRRRRWHPDERAGDSFCLRRRWQ
jgi:hypothetical protein